MEPAELIGEIIDNLRRIFQVLNEYSKKIEHTTGLTSSQLWAIKILSDGKPIKATDLARRMYLHPATVGGVIDRLHSRGIVKRTRSKEDRRVVWVQLAQKGKDLVNSAPEVAQGLLVIGLEKTPAKRLREINNGLKRLVKFLGAEGSLPYLILSQDVSLPLRRKSLKKDLTP